MDKKKRQKNNLNSRVENPNQKPIKSARTLSKVAKSKPKSTPENRLSDLENTLDLNIQILKTFYQSSTPVKSLLTNESTLIEAIDKIKKLYLKKKELFNQLKEKKSKSLIELQIYAEKKRKIEELKDVYQDKIEENEEGLNSKEEVIKKVQKRLKEVEIYIHKLTLNMPDKKRQKYYQDFLINDFLDINNELSRRKDLLMKSIDNIKKELQATKDENKLYKIKNTEEKTNYESEIKSSENKIVNEEKLKKLGEKYENKIELMNSRISLLKNSLQKMNGQFHLFDINRIIRRNSKSVNLQIGELEEKKKNNNNINDNNSKNFFKKINVKKKAIDRDSERKRIDNNDSFNIGKINDDDINNRINSFLDFSVLNNKDDENNVSKEKFGIIKNSIWDLSAINVKDISYIDKNE